jgi:hypothetical protein
MLCPAIAMSITLSRSTISNTFNRLVEPAQVTGEPRFL